LKEGKRYLEKRGGGGGYPYDAKVYARCSRLSKDKKVLLRGVGVDKLCPKEEGHYAARTARISRWNRGGSLLLGAAKEKKGRPGR